MADKVFPDNAVEFFRVTEMRKLTTARNVDFSVILVSLMPVGEVKLFVCLI